MKHKDPLAGATIDTVKRQKLDKTVLASGTVTSTTDLNLSFQATDTVTSVRVAVGDKVKKGQLLATLSSAQESAALTQANGALLSAQAAYNKVLEGSSSEEVAVAQVAYDTTVQVQNDLVASARRKLYSSDLFAKPQSGTSTLTSPTISGSYNGTDAGEYRLYFTSSGTTTLNVRGLETTTVERTTNTVALGILGLRIAFPEGSYSLNDNWTIAIPNTDGASYTANLNAYNAALATRDAQIAQAKANLDLKKASARKPDVDAAYAQVLSAQGQLQSASAQYEKKIVRAPADGTITRVDIKVGDQPAVGATVIVLQDVDHLYIDASINESDISELQIDQPITVTYDAFGPEKKYSAHVSSIDLSPTIEDGIVNYKIKAMIDDVTDIKTGMTANLSIAIASKEGVLVVPARMIKTDGTQKSVMVLTNERNGTTLQTTIETGLSGDGDLVEIFSGLSEGQTIVLFPKK